MNPAAWSRRPLQSQARGAVAVLLTAATLIGPAGGQPAGRDAAPVPVNVRTAPGRFDIAAADASAAHAVSAAADETWRHLAGLLDLPEAFSSPIFVRIVAAADTGDSFGAIAEAGGIVSVWLRSSACDQPMLVRRALTQGLLLRLGVALRGADGIRTVPAWLVDGCALWVDTRVFPARLDAIRYETRSRPPPAIGSILNARRVGDGESERGAASLWLLMFLHVESKGSREWQDFLQRVLVGGLGDEALAGAYPGRFFSVRERELWWQTGWYHIRRAHSVPAMENEESAREITRLSRFVFAPGDQDTVLPLRAVLSHAGDGIVAGEFERRAAELQRIAPTLHPFYRNAGLSLLELFNQARKASPRRLEVLVAAFEEDWRDASELATAATVALDAHEQR